MSLIIKPNKKSLHANSSRKIRFTPLEKKRTLLFRAFDAFLQLNRVVTARLNDRNDSAVLNTYEYIQNSGGLLSIIIKNEYEFIG